MILQEKLRPYRLLLASHSPRRQQLLRDCGLDYTLIDRYEVEERYPAGLPPHDVPLFLSQLKSDAYPEPLAANDILLTADTVVVAAGGILGKPHDREDAKNMLRRLSGREHTVYTGVCISAHGKETVFSEATKVKFFDLTDKEIADYVLSGEPMDKAGAYGIQGLGCTLVEGISGDYFNVVGLPVARVVREIKKITGAEK